jgi:hypothetical protein
MKAPREKLVLQKLIPKLAKCTRARPTCKEVHHKKIDLGYIRLNVIMS